MSVMVYKVLRKESDELWSISMGHRGLALKYSLDAINYPNVPSSYLFAFQTLEAAWYWIQETGHCSTRVIYRAETPSIISPKFMLRPGSIWSYESVRDFWESPEKAKYRTAVLPEGTVYCPSLKLLV